MSSRDTGPRPEARKAKSSKTSDKFEELQLQMRNTSVENAAGRFTDALITMTRNNPLRAVSIAAAIGFLFAKLRR